MTPKPTEAPQFAALVRTTGARNPQLLEALESVALQNQPCLAVVVVHGTAEAVGAVEDLVGARPLVEVLHASKADPSRKRGFPINVGIDHCLKELGGIRYLFLLDDDDIVYPFFATTLSAAFEATGADVVYSIANRREIGKPVQQAFPLLPYYHLLDRNFIPSNSYAIRTSALRSAGVRMDEDSDALEDWMFLLRLIEKGCRFAAMEATLSEFQGDSAADAAYRYDLESWKASASEVREYINGAKFPIPGADLAQLAEQRPETQENVFADSSTTAALHRRIWDLEHSLSWKCTAPVRAAAGTLLRLRSRWKARA